MICTFIAARISLLCTRYCIWCGLKGGIDSPYLVDTRHYATDTRRQGGAFFRATHLLWDTRTAAAAAAAAAAPSHDEQYHASHGPHHPW